MLQKKKKKVIFLSFIYKIEKYLFPLQRQDWKIPARHSL
jgi:hypothetical protein